MYVCMHRYTNAYVYYVFYYMSVHMHGYKNMLNVYMFVHVCTYVSACM